MKRFDWRWLVASSLLFTVMARMTAAAETRPQYGGTLHVAMRAAPTTLDPADSTQPDSFARRSLTILMFDTLVTFDESGRVQPSLAVSWQTSAGNQRWQFHLRHGVRFHDGSPLSGEEAAASLRVANPSWNVSTDGDSVVIECDATNTSLLAELALPGNAIQKNSSSGIPIGTGPFRIVDRQSDWKPGKTLTLAANENYWRGRPFLDGIEIDMGESFRDQMSAFELGKADLVEVAPEQVHRAALEGRRVASSAPVELLALIFSRDAQSPEEKGARTALALSIERGSIRSVLLQGVGQPAASILPNWMSGYSFVFPTDADLLRARHTREQFRTVPSWTITYEASDPMARVLAERIALNARDADLSLQPTSAATADLHLARISLTTDPRITLAEVAAMAGIAPAKIKSASVEDLYAAEQAVISSQRIIPLFHLPVSYAAAVRLKNWMLRADGTWALSDVWLGSGKL